VAEVLIRSLVSAEEREREREDLSAGEKAVFYFVNAVTALLPETQTTTQPEVTLCECEYKCGFKSESYEETLQHEKEYTFLRNVIFFRRDRRSRNSIFFRDRRSSHDSDIPDT